MSKKDKKIRKLKEQAEEQQKEIQALKALIGPPITGYPVVPFQPLAPYVGTGGPFPGDPSYPAPFNQERFIYNGDDWSTALPYRQIILSTGN